jgi:hypothetical protein
VTLDGRPITALDPGATEDLGSSGPPSPGPGAAQSRRDPLARLRSDGGLSPVDTGRRSQLAVSAPSSVVAPLSRSVSTRAGRAGGVGAGGPTLLSETLPPPSMLRTLSRAGGSRGVLEEGDGVRTGGFHTPSFRGSVSVQ